VNRELLEALADVAAAYYVDAMHRHPGLFTVTGVTVTTVDDRVVAPVLWRIDQLLLDIQRALDPMPHVQLPVPPPPDDDDIPF
jgi:hypothetical protein